jgi:C4-dicarboxylate transporter, DctQ subunit
MKTLLTGLEYAAGTLLFLVMILITASALSRYAFNTPLLDSDDISRLMLLPAVFFGLASACHHGEHIQVDLLWERLGEKGRFQIDRLSTAAMVVFVSAIAYGAVWRVMDIRASQVGTYELRLPLWPFFAVASLGMVLSAVVLIHRLLTMSSNKNEFIPNAQESA